MPGPPGVTAVLVAHDGARWLPDVLAALADQTVPPDRVVAVDTGSTDASPLLLREAYGDVLPLPRTTGYGAAVTAALSAAPPTGWVWLLHDDAAPDPTALEELLAHAATAPSAAALGPKAVDWRDRRVLVEVGLTVDGAGRPVTGLDPAEPDQGQHDVPRDVLAVGTAGLLVRRDAWDAVGGLDPALPLLHDDVDLGWRLSAAGHRVVVVPRARLRHARALTVGARRPEAVTGRPGAVRRRHELAVLLAHAPAGRLPLVLAGLLLSTVLRVVALLLTRRPRAAADEVVALVTAPRGLRRARRTRAATRTSPVGHLRPGLTARARGRLTQLADRAARPGGAREPRRPLLLLLAALTLVALVAARDLLGGGLLQGGRLLPAPDTAVDLWRSWAQPGGEPRTALLALLATAAAGSASLAVDLLVLLAVPLAGLSAWLAAGRVVRRPLLRAWAAATWALLPVTTGGVAAGRLDALVAAVALPLLARAGWSLLTRDPRVAGWHRAWALGLGLAVTTAFAPQLWPLLAVLLLGGALLAVPAAAPARRTAARRRAVAVAVAVAVPAVVLLPWTWLDAATLLHGPGRLAPGLAVEDLPAWSLLLQDPGGPATPRLLAGGLLLGALGGLLRTGRPRLAAGGWAVALVALAYALLLARTEAAGVPVHPGAGLQVAALGLGAAALAGADGLADRLGRASFGWRQLLAVAVVAATALVPVACAVAWLVRGADGPLQRGGSAALPAFVRADLEQSGTRALLLARADDGTVGYAVTGASGVRLGQPAYDDPALAGVVADLVSPRGTDAATALTTRAVRWVVASHPALAAALDAQDGLVRQPGDDPPLWRTTGPAGPVQLLSPGAARAATAGARTAPGTTGLDGPVPPGEPGRLVALAEPAGRGWSVRVDGRAVEERTAWGWAAAFPVPAAGGEVDVVRDGSTGRVVLQAALVLVVAVLAGPPRGARP